METRLDWLLGAAWVAGTLPILVASLPFSCLNSFHQFLLGFAKRGKIMQPSSNSKFIIPQRFFMHFYVLGVVWTTFLLVLNWHYAYNMAPLGFDSSDYPSAASHLIEADRAMQLSVRSEEKLPSIDFNWQAYIKPITKLRWWYWAGAALFTWGWLHQYICHVILGSLRENKEKTDEYVIPHGDWFELVSCPHYLAEMVIYVGLLVASGGSDIIMWLLLLFVVANLTFAAAETQRWYLHKFEDYPRNRRTVFPFVY